MNSGFITEMKDKNGDSWYHQIVVETQQEEINRLNNIIKEVREYIDNYEIKDQVDYDIKATLDYLREILDKGE